MPPANARATGHTESGGSDRPRGVTGRPPFSPSGYGCGAALAYLAANAAAGFTFEARGTPMAMRR